MNTLQRSLDLYRTRLMSLLGILKRAEAELLQSDPEKSGLLTARIAADMHPLPHQIWFTCRQPELLLAKLTGTPVREFEVETTTFADLLTLVADTIARIDAQAADDSFTTSNTQLEIPGFPTLPISGQDYIDEWLTPNFYFHFVTAYDILRAQGLAIGKVDYMSHLLPRLSTAMQT
jgi:hypothetical protein